MQPLSDFSAKTNTKAWPLGLRTRVIVDNLQNTKCPTKLEFKLDILKKHGKLDSVFKHNGRPGQISLFESFVKDKKFDFAEKLIKKGAMEFLTLENLGDNPYDLIIKKTRSQLVNREEGGARYRNSIYKLGISMMKHSGVNGIMPQSVLDKLCTTRHPLFLAARDFTNGTDSMPKTPDKQINFAGLKRVEEITIQKEDSSPDELPDPLQNRLASLAQALAARISPLPQGT